MDALFEELETDALFVVFFRCAVFFRHAFEQLDGFFILDKEFYHDGCVSDQILEALAVVFAEMAGLECDVRKTVGIFVRITGIKTSIFQDSWEMLYTGASKIYVMRAAHFITFPFPRRCRYVRTVFLILILCQNFRLGKRSRLIKNEILVALLIILFLYYHNVYNHLSSYSCFRGGVTWFRL